MSKEHKETNNPFYFLPKDKWEEIKKEIQDLKDILKSKIREEIDSEYLACEQVQDMLHITRQTWQRWRNRGRIPFIQIGRVVLVKRSDLDAFLNQHKLYGSAV